MTVAKELAASFEVFAVDLRNHGDSPHQRGMGFTELARDIFDFMHDHAIVEASILGHSLGGKVAMRFAMEYPEKTVRLIVVDIAPKVYPPHHAAEFKAMHALDLDAISSRKDADVFFEKWVPDWSMRQFLLTNLKRGDDGRWRWCIGLDALTAALDEMRLNVLAADETYTGPTQFIVGGASDFVQEEDLSVIRTHFPQLQYSILNDVGHNPHIEAKSAFLQVLDAFRLS